MDLVQRRAVELRHQKNALQQELAEWRGRTEKGKKLEKHYTQVLAITAKLDGFLGKIQEPDPQAADPFVAYDKIHRLLLGGHRIWAYFRSKLALRDVDWLADDLKCADELAWECYRPAREGGGRGDHRPKRAQGAAAGLFQQRRFAVCPGAQHHLCPRTCRRPG